MYRSIQEGQTFKEFTKKKEEKIEKHNKIFIIIALNAR